MRETEAVLFDLDDTLIDYQYSRRQGLRAVQELLPALAHVRLEELELVHDELLQTTYLRTRDGSLSYGAARLERMRGISRRYHLQPGETTIAKAAAAYAREQESNARLISGVPELLDIVRGAVKIGLITNGSAAAQRFKMERCDIRPGDFDVLAISEEVGAAKPDPAIFRLALAGLDVTADRATMVGDSWEKDVLGALGSGMAAVWFNRYARACPNPGLAAEIRGYEPVGDILEMLGIQTA